MHVSPPSVPDVYTRAPVLVGVLLFRRDHRGRLGDLVDRVPPQGRQLRVHGRVGRRVVRERPEEAVVDPRVVDDDGGGLALAAGGVVVALQAARTLDGLRH